MILDEPNKSELSLKASHRAEILKLVLILVLVLGIVVIGLSIWMLIYGFNATGYDRLIAALGIFLGIGTIIFSLPFLFLLAAFRAYRKCIEEEADIVYYEKGVNFTKNFFISLSILMGAFLYLLFFG
jgi:hypothetical protein